LLRIGWFATGRGQTSPRLLRAALDAIEAGLEARIEFVFSNQEPGDSENGDHFFHQVRAAGLPLITLSDRKFRRAAAGEVARLGQPLPAWRRDYDAAIARLLDHYDFDVGIMAGYLLILTEVLHDRWPFLNLHPALPDGPIGLWQDVIWQLIESRAEDSGVLIFLSTADLDRGPPLTYCRYSLRGGEIDSLWQEQTRRPLAEIRADGEQNPLFQAIRARGVARELPLVVETLRALARGRARIRRRQAGPESAGHPFEVVDAEGRPLQPLDLTPEVEASIAQRPSQP
jgi:phosphoribosylglycinamide formyltransferase-1